MFISLGSNCSITWFLNKYQKRIVAFPFDWCCIDNINKINNILENNWLNFVDSIYKESISNKHDELDDNNNKISSESYIFKNFYNIRWAHISLDIDIFKYSMKKRIDRFNKLKDYTNFIRVELSPIKNNYIEKLKKLINNLDKLNINYCCHIIVHKENPINYINDKIKIYYYDNFSPDWKQEQLEPIFRTIFE